MLNLGGLDHLASALGVSWEFLHLVLEDFVEAPARLVEELTLWPANQSKKPRDVICIRKPWRLIQERIYTKLLLPRFKPLPCCHGGVRRRSPATNAKMHVGNTFAFVGDISNFFPSIHCDHVNDYFLELACSYDVARALTRLCTHNHHLALGLITSPIIANQLLRPVDRDIARFCNKLGLVYSRFVDDIAISGKFNLSKCRVKEAIERTFSRHGLKLCRSKSEYGRLDASSDLNDDGSLAPPLSITGVRIKGNRLDASSKFIRELDRILSDHQSLANDGPFEGPLYVQGEVFGKVYYACSLNRGRRRGLLARMAAIDWPLALDNAMNRGLVRFTKRLTPRGGPRPDCTQELNLAKGMRYFREYYETHEYDPSTAPFEVTEQC